MPEPINPAQGGSYMRDPDTGALQQTEQTAPATGQLRRHADDEVPADAGTQAAEVTPAAQATTNPQPEA